MMNKNYSKAKVLTLIPIVDLVLVVACFAGATVLEGPTGRDALYTVLAFAGLMGMILSPLPCLVMSVIGTIFAGKAIKEGVSKAKGFLVLGILEILVHVIGAVVAVMIIIGGMSV